MKIFLLSILIIISMTLSAFADSCPYCGKGYGAAAPGDEARVYELRRQHEAQCSGSGGGYSSSQMTSDMAAGAADAFMRGFNKEMQKQQTYQGPTTEAQAMKANASTLNNVANDYYSKGDYNKAVELYTQALDYDPSDQVIRQNLENARAKLAPKIEPKQKKPKASQEEIRRYKQFEEDKKRINKVLNDFADALESMLSSTKQKGLKVKEVPKPGKRIDPKKLPLAAKERVDIILDALEYGNRNWDKSIAFIEKRLPPGDQHKYPQAREAISYLEGMRDVAKIEEDESNWTIFNPQGKDEEVLLDEKAMKKIMTKEAIPRKEKGEWQGPPQLDWKTEREELAREAVKHSNGDQDKAKQYLRNLAYNMRNSDLRRSLRAEQAYYYIEGFTAYDSYGGEKEEK